MKRLASLILAGAIAGTLFTACSKGSESANGQSSGPITDTADSGLKPTDAPTAGPNGGDPGHGGQVFSANCSGCHGAGGVGGGIGPSLKNEKSRKDYDKTIAWIKNPAPPMPKLYPSVLSVKDLDDVAAYVQSL